jgi:hypothetical protein
MAAVKRAQVQPTPGQAAALIAEILRNAAVQDRHETRGAR